jgi:integrase
MLETRLQEPSVFVPEAIPVPRGATTPAKPGKPPKVMVAKVNISDTHIEALQELHSDTRQVVLLMDANTGKKGERAAVPGLRIRIGRRSATWLYYRDVWDKDDRIITSKTLGHFPTMNTDAARDAARIMAGKVTGEGTDGKITFGDAFTEYVAYLAEGTADEPDISEAERASRKPARWRQNVRALGARYLLPKFQKWRLAEMSERRKEVGAWYNDIAKDSVSSGHHCRRIIRAIYNRQVDLGEKLPPENPARAKISRRENWQTSKSKPVLALDQFPAWAEAWRKLPPLNRAYHLTGLLTGARPGELSRTVWRDLDRTNRVLVIGDSKSGSDILVPVSDAILRALDMAREFAPDGELIFPGSGHWGHRDPLPARGHAMRRTYKTVAGVLGKRGISDENSAYLLGHVPPGVSAGYANQQQTVRSDLLQELQAEMSEDILRRLGADLTRERPAPQPPSAREVARAAGLDRYASDQECPEGHVGERYVTTNRCCACVTAKNFRQKANRASSRKRRRAA